MEAQMHVLESVGTFISTDGTTYPACKDGSADLGAPTHLDDVCPSGEWMAALSDEDKRYLIDNFTFSLSSQN